MKRHIILAVLALCSTATHPTHACCALGRLGEPVVNADQTVLLIWDPKTKTEHFIRKASFKAEGGDFGFLVPTPSRPQLSESGNEVFPHLADITRPRVKPSVSFGCSAVSVGYDAPKSAVTVIERKEVAGFDAVVLSANSTSALTGWLKTNGFHFSPEVEAWATPYVRDGWMLTALRVARRDKSQGKSTVRADALRITFQTERPVFPYREPDSREAAKKVGASSRLLRLYFISDARYEGKLDGTHSWSGKAVWSNPLPPLEKETLLKLLKLPPTSGPERWWLTEFEDRWPYGIAAGDLYFAPAQSQKPVLRWSDARATTDVSLGVCFAVAGLALLRKKRDATPDCKRRSAPRSGGLAANEKDRPFQRPIPGVLPIGTNSHRFYRNITTGLQRVAKVSGTLHVTASRTMKPHDFINPVLL